MNVCRTVEEVRKVVRTHRDQGKRIAFVPTMGALHDGHLSLVRAALNHDTTVVMSVFVNPLQFGPGEDLDAYPRDEQRDLRLAEDAAVDVMFLPRVEEVYPPGRCTTVTVSGSLTSTLEGSSRPGHFEGVTTVVAALFGIVTPDEAYFGEKDAQQLAVVRRMVRDLSMDVEIRACPVVRESDGLAMSSRNAYLTPVQREHARALFASLVQAEQVAAAGGSSGEAAAAAWVMLLQSPGIEAEYAAAVDPDTFEPASEGSYRLCVAARVGTTRLIDNVLLGRRTE